jgi:hypothetical protein
MDGSKFSSVRFRMVILLKKYHTQLYLNCILNAVYYLKQYTVVCIKQCIENIYYSSFDYEFQL